MWPVMNGTPASDALRDCVMPGLLPVLPGVELAGWYHGATPAGGDWFDAFVTDAGLVAGVCGDVAGPEADAARVELSTVLRFALLDGADVGSALGALHRHAARRPDTRGATVVAVLLDPAGGRLQYARCGHPPLLLRPAGGMPLLLDGPTGPPLGLGGPAAGPVPVGEIGLAPGDTVLACTDGLLRDRNRPLDKGLHWLRGAAITAATGAEALSVAATAVRPDEACDDAALLVIGMRGAAIRPVTLDLPADAGVLAGMRDLLTDWLAALDVTAEGLTAIGLVASELVSNAIEHAYAGRAPGRVRVDAELDGRGAVRLVVADDGRWRASCPAHGDGRDGYGQRGGNGLLVVRELARSLDVRCAPGGTTVTAECAVHRRCAVGVDPPRPRAAPALPAITGPACDGVVTVSGLLDASASGELHAAVLRADATGSRPVLDLAGVTLLTGAGMRLLHDLVHGPTRLLLRAPARSPVARSLRWGGLAFDRSR